MERIVDYSRVSTEEERQVNALKIQQQENEEFIKKQEDWILVDRYIDEGKTATTIKARNDFKRLLADIEKDKFDIILIKILDRGWRNTLDWKTFEKLIIVNKKKLYIRSRNAFYDFNNPMDYMATGMEAQFAEWSSINQSIKMNLAHKSRMKKGTVVTNGTIWGYNQSDGKLTVNDEEAEIVRLIYNEYVSGKGFRTIVQELSKKGITNHNGQPFDPTALRRTIKQEKYKGVLICGKTHKNYWTKEYEPVSEENWIIHEGIVPEIVSPELWDEANRMLNNKTTKYKENRTIGYNTGGYSYSGKIKCGKCGKPYYHAIYANKTHIWLCKGYKEFGLDETNGCNNILRIKHDLLNNIVKDIIFELIENKNDAMQLTLMALKQMILEDDSNITIGKLLSDKKKLLSKKDNILDLYNDGIYKKEDFKRKNDEYDSELEKIEEQLKSLKPASEAIEDKKRELENFKSFLELDIQDRSNIEDSLIKKMLKEIIVQPDSTLEIAFNNNMTFKVNVNKNNYCYEQIMFPNVGSLGQYRLQKDNIFKVTNNNILWNIYIEQLNIERTI